MKYTAELFNALCEKVGRYLPRTVFEENQGARSHPWQIQTNFRVNEKTKIGQHYAIFRAGLINGLAPYTKMPFRNVSAQAAERIIKNNLEKNLPRPNKDDYVRVYLDENAELKINWRPIGVDASPTELIANANTGEIRALYEPVPDFFKRLGVANANSNFFAIQNETQRFLRASDIVINQPRVALTNEVLFGSAALTGDSLVSIVPGFDVPTDFEPFMLSFSKFEPPNTQPTVNNIFFDKFIDTPFDLQLISTVFALSPQLPLLDKTINESWQIFVRYNLHFNLINATKQILPRLVFKPITLTVPLAAGIGQSIINGILADQNDKAQAVLDLYQQSNLSGRFYAV